MLSTSVADAFAFIGKPYTKETERFARTFDKFFDLFNVRSLTEGIRKCKPNLCPWYRNDPADITNSSVVNKINLNYIPIVKL